MPQSVSLRTLGSRFAAKERIEAVVEQIKQQVTTNVFKKIFIRLRAPSPTGEIRSQYFMDFQNFYDFLVIVRYTSIWDGFVDQDDMDISIGYQTIDRRGQATDHILYTF